MPPRNPNLPKPVPLTVFSKGQILADLAAVDQDRMAHQRIMALENGFRDRVRTHVASLPFANAKLESFNTSPFVLLIYACLHRFTRLSELEGHIPAAKLFSSIETSAGRMVEDVVLPIYGWQTVPSGMHSANSALDGKCLVGATLRAATLKSGPRCLNDEMSENFADNVILHGQSWLDQNSAVSLDFTYGVLYGTRAQSNKKDWHILRNIAEKLPADQVSQPPWQRWDCSFNLGFSPVTATIRIGKDWWTYLGGSELCLTEVCVAMIRACVSPGVADPANQQYTISDLGQIAELPERYGKFNSVCLQASQLPWLFLLMRHFCDVLND
ncbi:PmeII family type II restriction endonuclease [Chromobacterium violaceum]|uniref:PmeII family type II restriction endonuclease n=1 Tax=Chromobacterium violaceum TaxID=536 RepID=UPI0035A60455